MTLVWRPGFQFDADASTYIEAVEAADTQTLETGVRYAINDFVIGCKNDGIWDAIKASCILAGARTLNGALTPLVGTAPTNYNFVSGDYDRETGLVGDGSTKYLDSNRNNNADPQDSSHQAVFISTAHTLGSTGVYIGTTTANGASNIGQTAAPLIFFRNRHIAGNDIAVVALNFAGHSRSTSSNYTMRANGANVIANLASDGLLNESLLIFARGAANFANGRLAFYSIGEALDLALLDTRVTTLINAIGAAIP